jgi:hypothetical protein
MIGLIVAGIAALASQAGQSVQQWINSPAGQQAIQNLIKTVGPGVVMEIFKRLGLD